jgi:hypothetical protein
VILTDIVYGNSRGSSYTHGGRPPTDTPELPNGPIFCVLPISGLCRQSRKPLCRFCEVLAPPMILSIIFGVRRNTGTSTPLYCGVVAKLSRASRTDGGRYPVVGSVDGPPIAKQEVPQTQPTRRYECRRVQTVPLPASLAGHLGDGGDVPYRPLADPSPSECDRDFPVCRCRLAVGAGLTRCHSANRNSRRDETPARRIGLRFAEACA